MEELYWITRLDSISSTILALTVVSGIVTAIMTVIWLVCNSLANDGAEPEFNEGWAKIGKSFVRVCFPLFLVFLIGNTFIPTTKEAYLIYGVGGTIDYLRSDQTAKQIPHKVIVAVDKCLEELVTEDDSPKKEKKSGEEEEE